MYANRMGYDILSIDDVCSLIKDGTHQTPVYTEDSQNGFKFLSSKDVMTGKICWENIKYIPEELHKKLYATLQPQKQDILMSKNGVNYGVAAVNDTDEIFDIYVSLALLRPKLDKVNPIYFKAVINNQDTKYQFDNSIKGIGVPNLHLGEIKKTRILVPPLELQDQFADFVAQVDKSKLVAQKSLKLLERIVNCKQEVLLTERRVRMNTGIKPQVLQEICELAVKYGVEQVILFGSRARGDHWAKSDIDLAIRGGDGVRFALDVEAHASTLLTFDIVDLNEAIAPELRDSIAREGVVLYEKV